ncbi:MAG: universal stress protein [Devosiaceae bacterium]|nr:universal stress protein [Devosiaceae bacterium MH13]
MLRTRRAFEEGHKRTFLVILDETPECERAVIYAARRAERTGGGLAMLYVVPPSEFQHWLGVEEIMRAEAQAEADATVDRYVGLLRGAGLSLVPERHVREGAAHEAIIALIEEQEDIAILVLAAGTGKEGPGPLVSMIGQRGGGFPVPVTIVPGDLADDVIEAIA